MLALSALALAGAPLALDDSYSSVEHTTSEAAGQAVSGAWITRAGFLLFGLAVIWLAHRAARHWRQPATALHATFGACLLAVSAFSARSWDPSAAYDRTEDTLHSVAATTMGFAFALGVVATAWTRSARPRGWALDVVAVATSVLIPMTMMAMGNAAGVLQRAMFAIAYLWYVREALTEQNHSAEGP